MKKKYSYVFEKEVLKGKVLCEPDAIGLLLKELKGKSLPEQLHHRGIWIVAVDNKVEERGYLASALSPEAKRFFAPIPGFREEDFSPPKREFFIGINLKGHRIGRKKTIDWPDLCLTFFHEVVHTGQFRAHKKDKRYIDLHGRLSVRMSDDGDEDFCNKGAKALLAQGDNFEQVKAFLMAHRRHGDHSWVCQSHVMTFPF